MKPIRIFLCLSIPSAAFAKDVERCAIFTLATGARGIVVVARCFVVVASATHVKRLSWR